jgi:hypothetical protein
MRWPLPGDDGPDPPPFHGRYGSDVEPIGGVWYYRINSTGEIAEITVRVRSVEDWESSPEAADPTWRPMRFSRLVVALKALC